MSTNKGPFKIDIVIGINKI